MKRISAIVFLLLGLSLRAGTGGAASPQMPYFEARKQQNTYLGPGREAPEPEGLTEVAIGFFGPADLRHPEGGDLWLAANLAVEEANAEGGYRRLPFRLIPCWADNPWGNGVTHLTRMAYEHGIWAIIGGIDGPSTHLAEQLVAKARLALVSPASTDKTVNLANVPWMFSALPGDRHLAPLLGKALLEECAGREFVLVAANDHDSHQFLAELEKFIARERARPSYRFEFPSGASDYPDLIRRVVAAQPHTVVLIAGARDSAALLDGLRRTGFEGKVFGGPAMGRRSVLRRAAAWRGAVVFPQPVYPSPGAEGFAQVFADRSGYPPDYAAACAYESTRMLMAAIREAGLNRARICDALRRLSPWNGKAVRIEWDALGENRSPVTLGTIADGRLVPFTPPVVPSPAR